MSEDSFKDAPMSLTEARAVRANSTDLWTPRDVLIHMLRRIDSGELKLTGIAVCYYEDRGTNFFTGCKRGNLTTLELLGLLTAINHDVLAEPMA